MSMRLVPALLIPLLLPLRAGASEEGPSTILQPVFGRETGPVITGNTVLSYYGWVSHVGTEMRHATPHGFEDRNLVSMAGIRIREFDTYRPDGYTDTLTVEFDLTDALPEVQGISLVEIVGLAVECVLRSAPEHMNWIDLQFVGSGAFSELANVYDLTRMWKSRPPRLETSGSRSGLSVTVRDRRYPDTGICSVRIETKDGTVLHEAAEKFTGHMFTRWKPEGGASAPTMVWVRATLGSWSETRPVVLLADN